MTRSVDIRPHDLRTVVTILAEILPVSAQVWVFGSRVTGRARRGSDLDLAVNAGRRITGDESAALTEAFEDSDLPYTVDVVDLSSVNSRFAAIIEDARVPLPPITAAVVEER